MFIGKVCGAIVMTQKDAQMRDTKLLLVEPHLASGAAPAQLTPTGKNLVAVDYLGAGVGEYVLITQGSSARLTRETQSMPVDAVVIGIVDTVRVHGQVLSRADGTLVS